MTNDQLQAHLKSGKTIDYGVTFADDPEGVREYLNSRLPCPRIVCADGFSFSAQAGPSMYCAPRNNEGPYTHVEIGFPSSPDELLNDGVLLNDGEDSRDVYSQVPVETVLALIKKHGGVAE